MFVDARLILSTNNSKTHVPRSHQHMQSPTKYALSILRSLYQLLPLEASLTKNASVAICHWHLDGDVIIGDGPDRHPLLTKIIN